MSHQAQLESRDGFKHVIETSNGHSITFDEPLSNGGTNLGPAPTEMLTAALAACTALTIESYGRIKGWDLEGLGVAVDTTFDGPRPSGYKVTLTMPPALSAEQHERIRIIAGKCPVHRTLANAIPMEVV